MSEATVPMTQKVCVGCGIVFWMPTAIEEECLKKKRSWHCPNGHEWEYSKSECDNIKKRAEQAERRAEQFEREAAHTTLKLRAAKGQITKLRKAQGGGS